MSIFGIESPFYRGMSKLVQMLYLGLLWFVCSIPIITIGASTTALMEVLLKAVKNEENYVGKAFFQGFKKNFRQATSIWLVIFGVGFVFLVNLFYYGILGGGNYKVQMVVFAVLVFLCIGIFSYIFPLLARFENTVKGTFQMCFTLLIRKPIWTIVLVLLQLVTVLVVYFFVYLPLPFIAGISGYAQAAICRYIFDDLIENGNVG